MKTEARGHSHSGATGLSPPPYRLTARGILRPSRSVFNVREDGRRAQAYRYRTFSSKFRGQPILEGVVFEREVLRCSACQERYVASLPEGVSETRYEASADVAIVLAKYGAKLPFYRLAQMQESCGVPVSESVMYERSEQVADRALPVYLGLKQEAANGEVIHTDDTTVKILSCLKEDREEDAERRATNSVPSGAGID